MTPDGWSRVRLSEVADQRTAKSVPIATDTRPYVALEHLAQGSPTLLGWSKAGTAASVKTTFRAGDVLFGKLRPYLRKAAPAPFDGLCSTDILPLFGSNSLRRLSGTARAVAPSTTTRDCHLVGHEDAENVVVTACDVPVLSPASARAAKDCRDPLLGGRGHRKDSGGHRPSAGRQARPDAGLCSREACRGGTRVFKETEIGRIPKEWTTSVGADLFSLAGGYGKKALSFGDEGECLFIKVDSLNNRANTRQVRFSTDRFKETENPTIRTYGSRSLVFPKRGAAIFKNRVRLLGAKVAVDPNLMVLTPKGEIDPEFFMYWLLHIGLFNLSDNSGIPQINNKHLYPKILPCSNHRRERTIAKVISAGDDLLVSEEEKINRVSELRKALMSVLLTGELRVTPDPEPE